MEDFTACTDTECKMKENCYRFTTCPGLGQPYFSNSPRTAGECPFFWEKEDEFLDPSKRKIIENAITNAFRDYHEVFQRLAQNEKEDVKKT
ncbi:hypothetical protein [Desulfosporosinus hippei]|uniref:Uncharacterized protein n=1 Tax=Desulfosporosinus hippei DSM 8344 TaxID=1121419 RepID=A0A1G8CHG3_9FIRM|nr:hypothetical protein [Desulfosporosinus hippei]SDH44832.1 hypothetical protein SAMN05443529_113101 [Desulfosporosinus hippei DSM 8344]